MEIYHHIWLAAHPWRTQQWLKEKLSDGFDIHHLDGDHANNISSNLVLLEASDHMMLHSGGRGMRRLKKADLNPRPQKEKAVRKAKLKPAQKIEVTNEVVENHATDNAASSSSLLSLCIERMC